MTEVEMTKWRALLVPQKGFRCKHCASKQEDHLDKRGYTTQTPVAITIHHSKESITFRNNSFSVVSPFIDTKCEVCRHINTYPLNFWEEEKIKKRVIEHQNEEIEE